MNRDIDQVPFRNSEGLCFMILWKITGFITNILHHFVSIFLMQSIFTISGSRTYFGVEKTNVVIITYGCTKDQVIILIRGIDVLIFRTILSFSNLSKGSEHYILEAKAFQLTWFEKILQKPPTLKKILRFLKHRTLSMQFKRLECIDPILDIERKLVKLVFTIFYNVFRPFNISSSE